MLLTLLPFEIITRILRELPKESLKECLLVCRLMSTEAARLCYHEIVLSNNHRAFLNVAIDHENCRIANFVRVLVFSFESRESERIDRQDFELLIANLPQLTTLRFNFTSGVDRYLQYLLEMPIGLLNTLQVIDIPKSNILKPTIFTDYILVSYRLRSTLTTLCLDDFRAFFDGKCVNVLRFLSQFANLKSLFISNNLRTGIKGINMLSVLYACRRLSHLELTSEFSDMDELTLVTELEAKNADLKVLKLNVQDLTESNIDYITRHISSPLDSFHLQTSGKGLVRWLETTNRTHVDQLVYFLKDTKSITIHMSENIQEEKVNNRGFDVSSAWGFIHQLYQHTLVYELKILLSEDTRCFHNVALNRLQKYLIVDIRIPFSCINMKGCLNTSFVNTICITNFSQLVSFEIGPTLIRIMDGFRKEQLWSIKLYDGEAFLSISPSKKSLETLKRMTMLGQQDRIPENNREVATLCNYDVNKRILDTIASLYPTIKAVVLNNCSILDAEVLGPKKHQYNIDLKAYTHLQRVSISTDAFYLRNSPSIPYQFFIRTKDFVGLDTCYSCILDDERVPNMIYSPERCKPSVIDDIEDTFIFALQCDQIDEVNFKAFNNTKIVCTYRAILP